MILGHRSVRIPTSRVLHFRVTLRARKAYSPVFLDVPKRSPTMAPQISQADIDSALAAAREQIRRNWGWFLALGIVFVLAGLAAIAFPLLSTIAAKVVL